MDDSSSDDGELDALIQKTSVFAAELRARGLVDEPSLATAGSLISASEVERPTSDAAALVDQMFDATYRRLNMIRKEAAIERIVLESHGAPRTALLRRGVGTVSELDNPPASMLRALGIDPSESVARYAVSDAQTVTRRAQSSRRSAYGANPYIPPAQWEAAMISKLETQAQALEEEHARARSLVEASQVSEDGVRSDGTVPTALPKRVLRDVEFQQRFVNAAYKRWLLDAGHPIPDDLRNVTPLFPTTSAPPSAPAPASASSSTSSFASSASSFVA